MNRKIFSCRNSYTVQTKITKIQNNSVCECCGGLQHIRIASKRSFDIFRCCDCCLIFVSPQPSSEQLARIYTKSSGYFTTACNNLSNTSKSTAISLHKLIIANGLRAGSILDVGCSTGKVIYHLQQLGWQVAGMDINADAVAVALKNNLNVTLGELEQCPYPRESFDVIHMGNVIEHVRSPRQTLLTAHSLLREGGLIVIKTPNADCGFAVSSLLLDKVLRFPWPHSEAPHHLYEFTPNTLSMLLSETGFKVDHLSYSRNKSFIYIIGATGLFDELKVSMKKTGRYRCNWKLIMNIPRLMIVSSILLPFFLWGKVSDRVLHTGPKITLIAKRFSKN